VSDQGFIGETEARLRVSSREQTAAEGSELGKSRSCELRLYVCYSAVTCGVWLSKTIIVCVLKAVARRRLVETENPSACATVNWKMCK
jgi:hypothetical protein